MSSAFPPASLAKPDDHRQSVAIYGHVQGVLWPAMVNHVYPLIGLPHHSAGAVECPSLESGGNGWDQAVEKEDFLGSCLTIPLKLQALSKVDVVDSVGLATGCINTTYLRPSSLSSSSSSPPSSASSSALSRSSLIHIGTNTDAPALTAVLLSALLSLPTPFPPSSPRLFEPGKAAAFAIGGGGAVRATIYSLTQELGCETVFLLNRDVEETRRVVETFSEVDVRAVESVEQAEKELGELERRGVKLIVGVGAVPCKEPETEQEKRMYEVARTLFRAPCERNGAGREGYLCLPEQRVFVDMAYKPRWTLFRKMADEAGWQTRCGSEVALENAFEQIKLWTNIDVPAEARESARMWLEEA
ncbi:hypothetical protein JCM8547_007919 [Rhodosporidiobolus lusitaniae]